MAVIEIITHRAAICGYVSDGHSGEGLRGATVQLLAGGAETRTGADGFYSFLDLADGLYTLAAAAPQLGSRYGTVQVTAVAVARAADGRPLFDSKGNLGLPPTRLSGTVRRSDTLAPIAYADVHLRASRVHTKASPLGQYALSAVEAGTQTVEISAVGFMPVTQAVSLTAGQDTIVDFHLTPS
jgi:hypothetical protein